MSLPLVKARGLRAPAASLAAASVWTRVWPRSAPVLVSSLSRVAGLRRFPELELAMADSTGSLALAPPLA